MSKKKKYTIWIIIIAVIIGGVVIYKSRKNKVEYTTEEVKSGTITQTVSVTGKILSEERADLDFEISGRVKSVSVNVGDQVKKGQEIARLEDDELRYQLVQAQRDRDIQQENLDLARRHWDDDKPEEREVDRLTVRKAQAAVELAGAQLAKTVLRSPIDGVIARIDIEAGENVTAGSALLGSSTSVATIIKEGGFEIDTDIPESDITKVALGQSATITLDALPSNETFQAEVKEIEPTATVIQEVVYYGLKLKIDNIDERFRDGMSVDIDINTKEKSNVLMISQRAVKIDNETKKVQILLDNDEVQDVEVETGLRGDDGMIEIISGLKEGQKVVVFTSEK